MSYESHVGRWTPRELTPEELRGVRLLDIEEVCGRAGVCRAQVYMLIDKGHFPSPIKITPGRRGAVRWPDLWISEWIAQAINQQRATAHQQENPHD